MNKVHQAKLIVLLIKLQERELTISRLSTDPIVVARSEATLRTVGSILDAVRGDFSRLHDLASGYIPYKE